MKYLIIIVLVLGFDRLYAQEAISVTGGNASGSGGSLSYSVGQVFYTTDTGTNGSVAKGVQQPYEISVFSGNKEIISNLVFSLYPNPTNDFLILKVENCNKENLSYQLFNLKGQMVENGGINSNETTILVNEFVPGTYFLKLIDNKKEVRTFKIVKN